MARKVISQKELLLQFLDWCEEKKDLRLCGSVEGENEMLEYVENWEPEKELVQEFLEENN